MKSRERANQPMHQHFFKDLDRVGQDHTYVPKGMETDDFFVLQKGPKFVATTEAVVVSAALSWQISICFIVRECRQPRSTHTPQLLQAGAVTA